MFYTSCCIQCATVSGRRYVAGSAQLVQWIILLDMAEFNHSLKTLKIVLKEYSLLDDQLNLPVDFNLDFCVCFCL